MGGGGAASTTVLVFEESAVPSLFVGSGSGVVATEETWLSSVPVAGAVPVTVRSTEAPLAREARFQVTVPPATTPPSEAVTSVRAGGNVSVISTSLAVSGPLFVTVIVNSSWPPAGTVGGADLLVTTSAPGRGVTPLQPGAG